MDEILDIVNENDEVIGKAKREDANHNPNVIHREIGIIIYDQDNRVLLQQRSKNKTNPGLWILSVAGHVTSGMSYEETAHKELLEELGFDTGLNLVSKELFHAPSETAFMALFAGLHTDQEIKFDSYETAQIKFFSPSEFETFFVSDNRVEPHSAAAVRTFWKNTL